MKFVLQFLAISLLLGCIEPSGEVVGKEAGVSNIDPIIEKYFLGGYTDAKSESLFVVSGSLDEATAEARNVLMADTQPRVNFGESDLLNLVVFRGVFHTGGYDLVINDVEKVENDFTIHSTYTDPGKGMMLTQAFTQPTAIIPIGIIQPGNYEVRLMVTQVIMDSEGENVSGEKEHGRFGFTIN